MKARVSRSFRVKTVQTDLYQTVDLVQSQTKALPAGVTPLRLASSERLPKVKLPEDNPLTVEGVALGRRLFNEPRLSRNNAQSCASCHDPARAFTDGQSHSLGTDGQAGRRNAMSLVNLAWAPEFFWDGRAKALREPPLIPIPDAHEMNGTLGHASAKLVAHLQDPAQFKAP